MNQMIGKVQNGKVQNHATTSTSSIAHGSNFHSPYIHGRKGLLATGRMVPSFLICLMTFALAFSADSQCEAQISVQLPQERVFRTSSSYWVPDGGTAFGGGISSGSSGITSRGGLGSGIPFAGRLLGNRSIGRSTGSGGVWTNVQIISLKEMEEGLMNGTLDSYGRPIVRSPIPYRNPNDRAVSYSWAKELFAPQQTLGKTRQTGRSSSILPASPSSKFKTRSSAFSGRSLNHPSKRRINTNSQPATNQVRIPTNEEIRQRAEFLKRNIGRKK